MKENEMVFGIRAVIEAIQADKEVDKILVKRDLQGDLSKVPWEPDFAEMWMKEFYNVFRLNAWIV